MDDLAGRGMAVPRRLTALDGLRGAAALAVVVDHIFGTTPAFIHSTPGSLAWWLSYTPISLLWNGKEAVIIFFVLSGFVLARPFLSSDPPPWRAYYPRRLLRLYVPMWGAIVFTVIVTALVTRQGMAHSGLWSDGHVNRTSGYIAHDALLPHQGDTFDGPLWSLRWEILFSLALPLYIVVARVFRWSTVARCLVFAAIVALGLVELKVGSIAVRDTLLYLPMFGVGVLLAAYEEPLLRSGRRLVGRSGLALAGLLALTVVLADLNLEVHLFRGHQPAAMATLAHGAGVVGAAMLVWLVLSWPAFAGLLDRKSPQWVGQRSFSLYLIHEPVLVAVALLLGGHPAVGVLLVVGLPASLMVAAAFHWVVERPGHHLANAVGRWAGRLRTPQPVDAPAWAAKE